MMKDAVSSVATQSRLTGVVGKVDTESWEKEEVTRWGVNRHTYHVML